MSTVQGIHTELVKHDHAYTEVDVPWRLVKSDEAPPLFRYLRGGGVQAFGQTSHEMARARRQVRFLIIFGVFAAIWFVLWMF